MLPCHGPESQEEINSTVDSRSLPAQSAFHCSAHFKPLQLRSLGVKALLGRGVCMAVAAMDFSALSPGWTRQGCPQECGNCSCWTYFHHTN